MATDVAEEVAEETETEVVETAEPAIAPVAETPAEPSEHDTLEAIITQAQKVTGLRNEYEDAEAEAKEAKEVAKAAKTRWEGQAIALERLILGKNETLPLFDKKEPIGEVTPKDESWREVKIEVLELPHGLIGKLYEANIETLGQLADYTLPQNGNKRLTDITGVGPGAVEKIEAATTQFWATYQQPGAGTTELKEEIADAFREAGILAS